MRKVIVSVAFLLAVLLSASRASAQDMAEMQKWATAKLIHYHVVGDFSGKATVLKTKDVDVGDVGGKVLDHVEIDFDWDQMQQTLAADPTFKNSPTKVESLDPTNCAAAKLNGPFEYFTFQSVRATAVMLALQGKRDLPPGSFQTQSEQGCGKVVETPAISEPVSARMQVPQPMMLAMPATPGLEMEISKDHKSFIQKINTDGWVWTMTPTMVK